MYDSERIKTALRVRNRSVLYRRRARGSYLLSAALYTLRSRLLTVGVILIIPLLIIIGKRFEPIREREAPREMAIPLTALTLANAQDRFAITHTIRDGDSIWRLSMQYHGYYSPSYQERLRSANPWLPEDPRQLKIGLMVKIPVL